MTSVSLELGGTVCIADVVPIVVEKFGEVFGLAPEGSGLSYNPGSNISASD